MKLQYLQNVRATKALPLSKEKFHELIRSAVVTVNIDIGRKCLAEGNTDGYRKAKQLLPAIQWVGYDEKKTLPNPPVKGGDSNQQGLRRDAASLTPTQLFMIDIDHMERDPREAWEQIKADMEASEETVSPVVIHVTPSGKGLRIVCHATKDFPTLKEHMDWLVECLRLDQYGDYDTCCKDFSRLSFLVPEEDFLYIDEDIFNEDSNNNLPKPIKTAYNDYEADGNTTTGDSRNNGRTASDNGGNATPVSDDDPSYIEYREATYYNNKVTEIVEKYVETKGKPEPGEVHNYYNILCKLFRNLVDNNARKLHAILPRFGHSFDETWKQCHGICKSNNVGKLPRDFFLFLVHNGFYPKKETEDEKELKKFLADDTSQEEKVEKIPPMPPVFREYCAIAPKDFILPAINALMPILGTLASNYRAEDYDGVMRSTTFFNVIYAPAGSGKSFAERMVDNLLKYIIMRDEISSMRELIYLNAKSGKAANKQDPEDPHVSTRIMPAINSQPEFLSKMRDNKGYHMFTFAEEVDSFNKGTRGGGSDKSDLFRIGWDNGRYGQSFKSAATFKGMVNIYYNFLLTGTPSQVKKLYANTEDGMVTRVSFCEIENQEFAERPRWKKMNGVQKQVIEKYLKRMDNATYMEPLTISLQEAYDVSEKDFDKEVPWRYTFRPFTTVDMEWIYKPLDNWTNSQRKEAVKSNSTAHDTFRRRTAQKGFRLALLCTSLYAKVGKKEQKTITDFVLWWMNHDLQESLKLFEDKMNKEHDEAMNLARNNKSLFAELPEKFTKEDVVAKAMQMRVRTKAKLIICRWKQENLIEKLDANLWAKKE